MTIGIITGSGKGIGFATTLLLLESDPYLTLLCLSRTFNDDINGLILKYPDRLIFHEVDISNHSLVNSLISAFIQSYGYPSFCICNAGIRSRSSITGSSLDLYKYVFEVNTLSQINITKTLLELKSSYQSHDIHILFISSIVGSNGFADLTTYAVSKSALEGFCKSAAVELASFGIRINCLAPGFVSSSYEPAFRSNLPHLYSWTLNKTPLARWGTCAEVAFLIQSLVSQQNSYMTGSVIYCDGGWSA